ncbi:MAG TPA: hypothetical protein VH352_27510, partial [Pseudonocardiaceae bacterium]|nr:hypothetical protein [Pseudonocardiaceae bacterium]
MHPNRRQWITFLATGLIVTLIAVMAPQLFHHNAAAATGGPGPTTDEAAAGAVAVGNSYPGGLPALLNLFDTGECVGVVSLATAPPACQSILNQIAQAGAGQSFPEVLPDLSGNTDQTVPPDNGTDPTDQITPDLLAELQADGAPPDLIAGLSQNPPVVPPAYNTLPGYQGGPAGGASANLAISPSTTGIAPTTPTDPTNTPPPTTTTPPLTTTTTVTIPPSTTTTITPPTTTLPTTTTTDTTTTPISTTTTVAPPPPPPPPLLVAVGDSVTSGHEARPGRLVWRTTCDDPGTGAAAPGSSWAGNLRALLAVPWNRYFNFAHSGASTGDVLATFPYTNPCGVVSQPVRAQIADATAVLAANPSRPGNANVAVATGGVNDTNWTAVLTQLVSRRVGGAVAGLFGAAPGWAVANPGACTDWTFGNPRGNPGAPPGAVPPAWNGVAASGGIAARAAAISLNLIGAD